MNLKDFIKEIDLKCKHSKYLKVYFDDSAPVYSINMFPDKIVFTDTEIPSIGPRPVVLQNILETLRLDYRQNCPIFYDEYEIKDFVVMKDAIILLDSKVN